MKEFPIKESLSILIHPEKLQFLNEHRSRCLKEENDIV